MARDLQFSFIRDELEIAISEAPPEQLAARYALAFRRLCLIAETLTTRARLEGTKEFWGRLSHILNDIDEQLTTEFVGGEEQ